MLPSVKPSKKLIYLDHAATTPTDPRVVAAMAPYWNQVFGNPSSLYKQGRMASDAISKSRNTVSKILNCKPQEIIFTAGATEAINLAIFGVARNFLAQKKKPHIISTKIEHHAVLKSLEALKGESCSVTLIDVDKDGFVDVKKIEQAIRPETVLVSVMYANNEIGSIEPIAQIARMIARVNELRIKDKGLRIYFHTDAAQAAGSLDLNVEKLGVDLLSINGSKIYGPKQTGLLYVRSGVNFKPIIYGGGQEKNLRSGTENVPGIIGLTKALELSQKNRDKENIRLEKLRNYFLNQLFKKVPNITLNGPQISDSKNRENKYLKRLPNSINVSIPGIEGEELLLYLDSYNIAASTGSACTSETTDPSHVLLAIGKSPEDANNSIRFTMGQATTKADLEYVVKILSSVIYELRKLR